MLKLTCVLSVFALGALAATSNAQAVAAVAGDIAVSEIMFNPGPEACVTDANGEWFEVTNISCKELDLNGLSFEDRNTTTGLPSGFGFTVKASVATLPSLFPGQSFVFARSSDTLVNGGLTPVDYVYAATTTTPAVDGSQVGSSQMFLNNSNIDGLFVATGGLASGSGTVIEAVTYNASAAPLTPNSGLAAERKNLFVAMDSTNANVAQSTAVYGPCTPANQGTPGATNTQDMTTWVSNSAFYTSFNDSLNQNTGTLTPITPTSVGNSPLKYRLTGGPANANYFFMYADLPGELYISLFLPGNPGAFLIDIATSAALNDGSAMFFLDGSGNGNFEIPVPNDPLIIGKNFTTQWLALDSGTGMLIFSNGVTLTVCP